MVRKFGFTLAEVLITLGIIGVVAAITIPLLITNYQKRQTITRLKKSYAIVANAVKLSEAENGDMSGWTLTKSAMDNSIAIFDNYIFPYLKCSKTTVNGSGLKYYTSGNKRETGLAILRGTSGVYTLLSGEQLLVSGGNIHSTELIGESGLSILLDINGYNTPPNRFGKDAFFISIRSNKGTVLACYNDGESSSVQRTREQLKNGPSKENYQCNSSGRGMWCGALIQRDGWRISKDYPW